MNGNGETETNSNMIEYGGLQRIVSGVQDEVRKAVHELKNEKATGADEVHAEMIKCSGERGLKWL